MSREMTRAEKLKLLQAIQDGRLTPDDIRDPQHYIFYETDVESSIYHGPNGTLFNQEQYDQFLANCRPGDRVICFRPQPGNAPLEDDEDRRGEDLIIHRFT